MCLSRVSSSKGLSWQLYMVIPCCINEHPSQAQQIWVAHYHIYHGSDEGSQQNSKIIPNVRVFCPLKNCQSKFRAIKTSKDSHWPRAMAEFSKYHKGRFLFRIEVLQSQTNGFILKEIAFSTQGPPLLLLGIVAGHRGRNAVVSTPLCLKKWLT